MAGLEFDVREIGVGIANVDHLVGGGTQGRDVGVDHLDGAVGMQAEPLQPADRIIPDQLLR